MVATNALLIRSQRVHADANSEKCIVSLRLDNYSTSTPSAS